MPPRPKSRSASNGALIAAIGEVLTPQIAYIATMRRKYRFFAKDTSGKQKVTHRQIEPVITLTMNQVTAVYFILL